MPDSIAHLDRIKRMAIIAMFSDDDLMERLVLKGGNLLDVVFGVSARASVDVDFSIDGEFDREEWLLDKASRALTTTFAEAGYVVFDVTVTSVPPFLTPDLKHFWGGYRLEFKLIEKRKFEQLRSDHEAVRRNATPVGKNLSTKFRIDISKHEYCAPKQPFDLDGYTIFTYSPEMVVCERLRAICQQMPEYSRQVKSHPSARARDFVDIHTLAEAFHIDFSGASFRQTLHEVFAVKRVPLDLLERISAHREYHRVDFPAVRATVKPDFDLREFDFYFDYVTQKCDELKALWDE